MRAPSGLLDDAGLDIRIEELRAALLQWFAGHQRDLPWRMVRDPWSILVAEVMLQQTQVGRVLDRWPAFLAMFPTPASCAAAGPGPVIAAWQGLGYPRRARALYDISVACVERFGGELPTSLEDLLALAGIGPYTARAVLVFAHETDVGVIDVNAARVLARAAAGAVLGPKEAQTLADRLVPAGRGWTWNQAMLDVGARYCRPIPQCDDCPLRGWCAFNAARVADRGAVDPAIGTFGTGAKQSRFDGSDRQGRGRLLRRLADGAVATDELAVAMGWPSDFERARRVAASLVADRLATIGPDGALTIGDVRPATIGPDSALAAGTDGPLTIAGPGPP